MRRKRRSTIIKNIESVNMKIDYDKLVETIVRAQEKVEEQKKIKEDIMEKQKREEIIKNRREGLGIDNDFDENGAPRKKTANLKLIWRFLWAKEELLKDSNILGITINLIVSSFFFIIEWFLYITAVILSGKNVFNVFHFISDIVNNHNFDSSLLELILSNFFISVLSFLVARVVIRTLKIECKYNNDNHYMLNFLAVIIAVIAITVICIIMHPHKIVFVQCVGSRCSACAEKGKEYSFTANFGDDCGEDALKGKSINYKVTVLAVQRRKELTDAELLEKIKMDSIDELRKVIRQGLERDSEAKRRQEAADAYFKKLDESVAEFDLPEALVEAEIQKSVQNLAREHREAQESLDQLYEDWEELSECSER